MRRRSLLIAASLTLAALLTAGFFLTRPSTDEQFILSLIPSTMVQYPDDPRNGGFSEQLYYFHGARFREIERRLAQRFDEKARRSAIHFPFGDRTSEGSVWKDTADSWQVQVGCEPDENGVVVCCVELVRRSTWFETLLFRIGIGRHKLITSFPGKPMAPDTSRWRVRL